MVCNIKFVPTLGYLSFWRSPWVLGFKRCKIKIKVLCWKTRLNVILWHLLTWHDRDRLLTDSVLAAGWRWKRTCPEMRPATPAFRGTNSVDSFWRWKAYNVQQGKKRKNLVVNFYSLVGPTSLCAQFLDCSYLTKQLQMPQTCCSAQTLQDEVNRGQNKDKAWALKAPPTQSV